MSFKGRKNIYVCDSCKGHIVTVDRDEGTTPFALQCECRLGCKGVMRSSMYRVFDQEIGASHEWYRPSVLERAGLSEWSRAHVEKGGLILRKVQA